MEEFKKLVDDFCSDLITTFPELKDKFDKDYDNYYSHCLKNYHMNFFDILYEKESLFEDKFFIFEGVDISPLMKENISENTKKKIWKYLQLILFFTLEKKDIKNNDINIDDIQSKIKEMLGNNDISGENVENIFKNMLGEGGLDEHFKKMMSNIDNQDLSNNSFKETIESMMNGNIGSIAKEIAEETNKEFGDNTPDEFMKNMFSNPSGIMNLVKNIGSKLEKKMGNDNINESDLFSEAVNIMKEMNNIPGMKEMMKNMGMNGKPDLKAMASKIEQNNKKEKNKERMREKLKQKSNEVKKGTEVKIEATDKEDTFIFKTDDSTQVKKSKKKKRKNKNI